MRLFNTIIKSYLNRRISDIDLYRVNPHPAQERIFNTLISKGKTTVFGKKYGFSGVRSPEDFNKLVPLSTYEQLYPWIERVIKGEQNILWPTTINWFSKSSGTTNAKSKFIPVTKEALQESHYKGGKDLLSIYFNIYPDSKLFQGKGLGIGGSYYPNPDRSGSYFGDISAVIMANLPSWAQFARTPDLDTALMNEWESKIERIANRTVNENVSNISGVPTWTYVLLERILEMTGKKNMLEVWPNFEAFFHGAVSFTPYRGIFNKLFPGNQVHFFETYNASEGFFGMQDQADSEELLLMLDYGTYYEFIPIEEEGKENPKVYPLDQVEKGKVYSMVISTNAGLWRYRIGDTIKFTSLSPYRIRISGRTKHFINAFGEELMVENAETALSEACRKTDSIVSNFTAAPLYFDGKNKARHEWIIEFAKDPSNLSDFTKILDQCLKEVNSDYEAKRHKDLALLEPLIHLAPHGTFYSWMKKRGKLGGQNKVPRLSNTREYLDDILKDLNSGLYV